ncbi:hypothetical protein [Vibrio cyclitrophicus]|uniref:hypothetical protein n=1 Tax=Vibrio cyclitrophicus TaxID=47951 RepID=UPI0032E3B53A
MKQSEMKHLIRNPSALIRFNTTGHYQKARPTVSTPLRKLIESIPRDKWSRYKGVRLSPKLGFKAQIRFDSIAQMYRWLGGDAEVVGNRKMPYQYYIINSVTNVSMDQLIEHCSKIEGVR